MGTRRYAKSGLGFLLAFALISSAAPAVAGPMGESGPAQSGTVQSGGAQKEAAAAPAAESSTSTGSAEPAVPVTPVVEEKLEAQPATSPVEPQPATETTVEQQPVAETRVESQPAAGTTESEPAAETTESQPTAGSTIERTSGPVAAPTQTQPPASTIEETAVPAPEPQSPPADPGTRPSDITVKVYKMITGLDEDIAGAVPKAGWEFSISGASIKDVNPNATTNGNGLAVFSGEAPGASGKANVTITESDPAMSDYDLVRQYGKNAVCSAGGEAVDVENSGEAGFQIRAIGGETVTCTVYNRPLPAQLTLINTVKNGMDGTASAADWNLTATPDVTASDTITSTGSVDGHTFTVAHGSYELSQSTGPEGYTWQSLKCSTDGGPAVNIEDFRISLGVGTETTCTFTNAFQGIDVDKRAWNTAGFIPGVVYPDAPEFDDGALVPFGTTVTWTYTVTNTGGTAISGITVDDDKLAAAVGCPDSRLAPGESMICTASGLLTG